MPRVVMGGLAAVAALVIALFGLTFRPLPGAPDATALRAAAKGYDAEIVRDAWGVPHVFGKRDADAAFGLGYAHAEDDYETIQFAVAATRGRLARYKGASGAPTDYLVSFLDVWGTIKRGYASTLAPEARAMAEGYAAGLNLYAAEHPKKTWPGLAPFTGEDVVAGFVFKTPLFYGLDDQLAALNRGVVPATAGAVAPQGGMASRFLGEGAKAGLGSNAFAVAPKRSTDAKTRLLINSHQPYAGPVAWYEAHIVSEEGLDAAGGTFPGAPLILTGFNRRLGWANTVSKPDLVDLYRIAEDKSDRGKYRFDGGVLAFTRRTAVIEVRLWGPFVWTVRKPIRETIHGPVFESKAGLFAVRYAGRGEVRQLEQYRRLNKAQTFDDWMAALQMLALPSINYVYADADGRIAFIHNAQYPNRAEGPDWSGALAGDDPKLIWEGYRPWEAVPKLIDPASGFLFSANNTPTAATDGPDNLRLEAFPAAMGLQTNMTNRALRILALTDAKTPLSEESLLAIKNDTRFAPQSLASRAVAAILALDWSAEPEMAEAAAQLAQWDFDASASNRGAALALLSTLEALTEQYTDAPPPPPADAFRRAVRLLKDNFGRLDPEWGEVNRLVRGATSLPLDGASGTLRSVHPKQIRPDGRLHANAGDAYIALLAWNAEGELEAKTIHQFGAATLDETSAHYADQAPLFAAKRFKPFPLDLADIRIAERYRPGARKARGAER